MTILKSSWKLLSGINPYYVKGFPFLDLGPMDMEHTITVLNIPDTEGLLKGVLF
jgi:hypothetical protein